MLNKKFLKRITSSLICIISASMVSMALADTQRWPTKPLTLITPFPPGGGTDETSRYYASKLSDILGQPVVVMNVPGAGGTLGMQRLVKATPDGYTIGIAHSGTHSITPHIYPSVGYNPIEDFTPISQLYTYANFLVVNANTPYNTLNDLLNEAKIKPRAIDFASGGNGSSNHLSAVLLANMSGVHFTHIPYRGNGPALIDVLSGVVPFMFDTLTSSLSHIETGRIRALATTASTRDPRLPDVPTVAETLPGYEVVGWTGIVAPTGVPAKIVKRLEDAVKEVTEQVETNNRLNTQGRQSAYAGSVEFSELIRKDFSYWGEVINTAGVKVD